VISGSLGMLASGTVGGAVDLYNPSRIAPDIAEGIAISVGGNWLRRPCSCARRPAGGRSCGHRNGNSAVLDAGYHADIARNSGHLIGTVEMGIFIAEAVVEIATCDMLIMLSESLDRT